MPDEATIEKAVEKKPAQKQSAQTAKPSERVYGVGRKLIGKRLRNPRHVREGDRAGEVCRGLSRGRNVVVQAIAQPTAACARQAH